MTEEKNYMMVQDGCGVCDYAKKFFKDSIKNKELVLIDADSKKGEELIEKLKIEAVPVIINEKDAFQQKCFISKNGNKMFCDDGTEKEIIKKESE